MKLYGNYIIMIILIFVGFSSCKDKDQETETFEDLETQEEVFNERLEEARGGDELLSAVQSDPELSTFAQGLHSWNVEDSLAARDSDTTGTYSTIIFAPTNLAYSQVRQGDGPDMLRIDEKELIAYHIIRSDSSSLSIMDRLKANEDTLVVASMQGANLKFSSGNDKFVITDVTGQTANVNDSIITEEGMVYIIDKVLMPRDNQREVTITAEK